MSISYLKKKYRFRQKEIEDRVSEFSLLHKKGEEAILSELSFCICAANSSASAAFSAQQRLLKSRLLYSESTLDISEVLLDSRVRFHNNKAKYIIEARQRLFCEGFLENCLFTHLDDVSLRDTLAKEIKGLGMKEASHFLRNTGIGTDMAILDRHILKNLLKFGAIDEIPASLSINKYKEIEEKMQRFSKKVGIGMCELDLLFWSEQTGYVFK